MKTTVETALIRKFIELDPKDQVDVLDYINHIQRVRRISEETTYQENALKEIREALSEASPF